MTKDELKRFIIENKIEALSSGRTGIICVGLTCRSEKKSVIVYDYYRKWKYRDSDVTPQEILEVLHPDLRYIHQANYDFKTWQSIIEAAEGITMSLRDYENWVNIYVGIKDVMGEDAFFRFIESDEFA